MTYTTLRCLLAISILGSSLSVCFFSTLVYAQYRSDEQPQTRGFVTVRGTIVSATPSPWKAEITRVRGREELSAVFFSDPVHGWIGAKGAMYETEDGGKNWHKATLAIAESVRVWDIFFADRLLGWVVLQSDRGFGPSSSWLMHTKDGGLTWGVQWESTDAGLTRVSITNAKNGWLTGSKWPSIPLVFHTVDRGEHWTDVSASLLREVGEKAGGSVRDVIPEGSLAATVLTPNGVVFTTTDAGRNWREIARLPGEPPQTCVCHFGIKQDHSLWLAGGANSIEGTWGTLAVMRSDNSWVKYEVDAYLSDFLSSSNGRFFASGLLLTDKSDRGKSDGVILYSSDEGRNWSIIYRSTDVSHIGKLFALDSRHLWAVGKNGLVVRLESTE